MRKDLGEIGGMKKRTFKVSNSFVVGFVVVTGTQLLFKIYMYIREAGKKNPLVNGKSPQTVKQERVRERCIIFNPSGSYTYEVFLYICPSLLRVSVWCCSIQNLKMSL